MRLEFCALILVGLLLGCGGASSGVGVGGTVNFDGKPLPWGRIFLRGAVDEKTSQAGQAFYEVRDGQFSSGSLGLPEGPVEVTIFVYEGAAPPPATAGEESPGQEPKVLGLWEGAAEIKSDQPMSFDVKKESLKSPENSSAPVHNV